MVVLATDPAEHTNYGAVLLMAATGIPLAATNIFPFSIIGRDFGSDPNLALYMGSLNIFIVLPQLLDTLYSGKVRVVLCALSAPVLTLRCGRSTMVAHQVAETWGWNVVLLIGAAWTLVATVSIFFLKIGRPGSEGNSSSGAGTDKELEQP